MSRFGVLAASGWLLVACSQGSPVGKGERPVQFYLSTPTGGQSFGLSECSAGAVQAILVFDGSSGRQTGDYSSRATWTSDAPGIVSVSGGNLLAHAPGTANITAQYLDFTASASVVVLPAQQLYITPSLTDLAPDVDQQYLLWGVFADSPVPINLTTQAQWDLNGENSRATVGSATGIVHTGAASIGAPVQVFAHLPVCGLEAHSQFQVTNVSALKLKYEFTCDANGENCVPPQDLPVGTSIKLRVLGEFGDKSHTEQNLSQAVTIHNLFDPKLLLVQAIDATGDSSIIMQATDLVSGAYIDVGLYNFALSAQTQPINLVTDPLVSVAIPPQDKNLELMYPSTGHIDAIGTFTSGLQIPITRHVAWSVSDPTAAKVDPTFNNAGLITIRDVNEDVTITAASGSASVQTTDTADLKIFAQQ
ncbi:MAG TPA: hypothetical protein VFB36_13295 [Nevskiaceae bacterium]|nr:hypothetical protein [Nevskiaceae bacterium]